MISLVEKAFHLTAAPFAHMLAPLTDFVILHQNHHHTKITMPLGYSVLPIETKLKN